MKKVFLCVLVFVFDHPVKLQALRAGPMVKLGQKMGEVLRGADQSIGDDGSLPLSRSAMMETLRADEASLVNPNVAAVVGTANGVAAGSGIPTDLACTRNWSALCPDGWSVRGRHQCMAPVNYEGPCKTLQSIASYSVAQKSKFAIACKSPWPCVDKCAEGHDYETCPKGWYDIGGGSCKSREAAMDTQRCGGTFKFGDMTLQDKQDFGLACGFEWACKRECNQDFSVNCPQGWVESSSLCVAPVDYMGDCGNVLNASGFTETQKRAFAENCAVKFPCAGGSADRKQLASKGSSAGARADGPLSGRVAQLRSSAPVRASTLADKFAQRFVLPSGPVDERGGVHF